MQQEKLAQLTRLACEAVKETAAWIRAEQPKVQAADIEEKFRNGLVSYVDKTAEKQLVEALGRLLPEAGFVTEEDTVVAQPAHFQWIIDPLDGTTNFLYGLPHYSISVGLLEAGEPVLGIVHHVPADELFYAWKNGGAFLNGQPIRCRPTTEMRHALVSTGFPYHNFERADGYFSSLKTFMQEGRGVRRFGSAALDLAWVACGRFDIFYEYGLSAWDVAGGAMLVLEGGGRVADFEGGSNFIFGNELVAASPGVFEEAMDIIGPAFLS